MPTPDREQFERLLDSQTYACAWGYARRLATQSGGARQDAEDLLQEALALAWRGLGGLRDEDRFKAWLLAIIRRRWLTWRGQRRVTQDVDDQPLALPATDPQSLELLEALAALPARPRELLSLFYLHGLSMEETAQVLDLAPAAIHMRLARAREMLRRALEPTAPATGNPAANRRTT